MSVLPQLLTVQHWQVLVHRCPMHTTHTPQQMLGLPPLVALEQSEHDQDEVQALGNPGSLANGHTAYIRTLGIHMWRVDSTMVSLNVTTQTWVIVKQGEALLQQ